MHINKNNMVKQIKQRFLVDLMKELVLRVPQYAQGTYNKQDPTNYSKGKWDRGNIRIHTHDLSWGVEIRIRTDTKVLAEIYLSYENPPVLIPRDTWKHRYFKWIKSILPELPEWEDPNEEWIDPAGGVHYGYDGDPAAKYE